MNYDKTSPQSIEAFAKLLINKDFYSIIKNIERSEKVWNKWDLWQLIEKYHFQKELDNKSEADFPEAWVELKATPIKRIGKWVIRAKERLVLNIINYMTIVDETWDNSTFIKKNSLILLVFYLYEKEKIKLDYIIKIVELFSFRDYQDDFRIIKQDWNTIQAKIKAWKAHELSEGDTIYLGACTKWSTAIKSLREQPFSGEKAKQRAFSFKQWYINYILKRIEGKNPRYEKLFKNIEDEWFNFEEELKKKFEKYIWKSAHELAQIFGLKYSKEKPKNYYALLSDKILWVKNSDKIEEFNKANITLRTIRQTPKWSLKENVSFPAFKISELIQEDWEESQLYNILESRKFFFVVYKITTKTDAAFKRLNKEDQDRHLILDKVILWNPPAKDIDNLAYPTWEKTISLINKWLILTPKKQKSGKEITLNNLPAKAETNMIHVRPHGVKWDIDFLPDWRTITKQSFWFNEDYITQSIWI